MADPLPLSPLPTHAGRLPALNLLALIPLSPHLPPQDQAKFLPDMAFKCEMSKRDPSLAAAEDNKGALRGRSAPAAAYRARALPRWFTLLAFLHCPWQCRGALGSARLPPIGRLRAGQPR
jgi:hypothetical protein